jgi:pseudouridine-5'-phosphate glycosidase
MDTKSNYLCMAEDVARALKSLTPVVALESTVITHGLPYPKNLRIAIEMEAEIRRLGPIPATIALLDGLVHVGVDAAQLEWLAQAPGMHKISRRDFGPALAMGWSGGTTVAGTMLAAHATGIRVFATGGIGGVHRQPQYDISADLPELARTPMVVVCAGAKAILDLEATLEYLETASVPVIGYQTDEFPAFYSRSSGLRVSSRVDSPEEIAAIAKAHWAMGSDSAVLVVNPLPEKSALPREFVENAIQHALDEAESRGVRGQAVTPFLLERVSALTEGASLQANLDLLRNNARLGALVANAMVWANP